MTTEKFDALASIPNYITIGEFKQWLDGYISGGGTDIFVVQDKLLDVYSYPQYIVDMKYPNFMSDKYPYTSVTY